MRIRANILLSSLFCLGIGCAPQAAVDSGASLENTTTSALSGCGGGKASSTIPSDGNYDLTSFGGSNDTSSSGTMSCGEDTAGGSWYYAASRQRYGCGSHIQITAANGKCVVAETDDYGPNVCVETAADMPIIDASPLVAQALFGVSSAGWSDHFAIHVVEVDKSTPLGPCSTTSTGTGTTTPPPAMSSNETCESATLGYAIPLAECVQSSSDENWYQCTDSGWVEIDDENSDGPLGDCTATYPL